MKIYMMTKEFTRVSEEKDDRGMQKIGAITYYISEGTPVHISNFGTFEVRKRAARVSHDVHSREKILVGEQNIPVFRAGKALKLATKQELSDEDMVIETLSNMILEVQQHD